MYITLAVSSKSLVQECCPFLRFSTRLLSAASVGRRRKHGARWGLCHGDDVRRGGHGAGQTEGLESEEEGGQRNEGEVAKVARGRGDLYCSHLLCRRGVSDGLRRRKHTVNHVNPKLRHEQVAGELGRPGTPSHGQRQSRAVDEESVMEGWVNESSARQSVWIEVGPKSLIELKGAR
jgi:hypothetical protein